MSVPNDVILYTYAFSPYGQRIAQYLQLRGIEYAVCDQPVAMPRPDLEQLGIGYRRIPLLSIGRDVYCDTRIILRKLEELFPKSPLGGTRDEDRGIEHLIDRYVTDGGIFWSCAGLIPPDSPVLSDEKFVKDREDLAGMTMSPENQRKGRPGAIVSVEDYLKFLETTFLADNRAWIENGNGPSLADLQAVWPLQWLDQMEGAVPAELLAKVPKTVAWKERWKSAVQKANAPKPPTISGAEAAKHIVSASYAENPGTVDPNDPTGLKAGAEISVAPGDWGKSGVTTGRLVTLTPSEVAIAVKNKSGEEFLTHFPRWGFKIKPAGGKL